MDKSCLKDKVIKLRQEGYSYELIKSKTGVPKSTLSNWLTYLPYKPNKEVIERMKHGSQKAGLISHTKRVERIKEIKEIAKQELGELSKRDLMLLGIGLYIGEGSKYNRGFIQFSNSDPKVIKLAMKWFKVTLGVEISHFRAILHIYPDNKESETLKFWSGITDIPVDQFNKTYVDKRVNKSLKNNRKLPYGTIHIRIRASGNEEFGVKLHQKILSWIEIIEDDCLAGIV